MRFTNYLLLVAALVLAVLLMTGCANLGYQGMSPEQLTALARMKDANINCIKGQPTLTGPFFAVFVNVDKGVIPEGGITVTPDCGVTLTNTRVITTVTTVTTPQPAPPK